MVFIDINISVFNINDRSPYYKKLRDKISEYGGMYNAHLHLDRAGTFEDRYFKDANIQLHDTNHIPLTRKHALIANVHSGPAYDKDDLTGRVRAVVEQMIELGTSQAHTMVDVTADRVQLSALQTLNELRDEYADRICIKTATYTPLGFNDAEPERWEIFEKGAEYADFIGALPEADDIIDYPDNIGFKEHCRRVLELATKHGKMVHFHTDQRNEPSESGTEQVLDAIREFGRPAEKEGETKLWVVHMVSPSTYDEERFERLAKDLKELNVGVICCPSAAVGMRQIRAAVGPTYNSIPRVLELLAAGVKVRIASDNIADLCSPSTTADLVDELFVLSAAVRFYHVDILARLAAGVDLDQEQIELIKDHLANNAKEIDKVISKYHV